MSGDRPTSGGVVRAPDLDLAPLDIEPVASRKHAEIEYQSKIAISRDPGGGR